FKNPHRLHHGVRCPFPLSPTSANKYTSDDIMILLQVQKSHGIFVSLLRTFPLFLLVESALLKFDEQYFLYVYSKLLFLVPLSRVFFFEYSQVFVPESIVTFSIML